MTVFPDDGMWMPHQMTDLGLKDLGLQMDPADLYKKDGTGLMSAVVHLGGGTGEFVSSQGLILTNHHVAFGAIQRAATKEHDYLKHGFLAREKKDEIPAKGYIADVLIGYEEVTKQMNSVVRRNMSHLAKYKALERKGKYLIARAERKGKDLRCEIKKMYSGNRYYLFKFKRLKDVRMVYAPPMSIGNFGGEVDNWMWPRHTGDFTFLRAYVSKDGVGTEYNENNVPYTPKSFFKISLDGVKDGDFTFVMGYPGRTYRNQTLAELKKDMKQLGERKVLLEELVAFFEDAGKNDRAIQIKYAGKVKGLWNSIKNRNGKLEGMASVDLLGKKEAQMKKFSAWVSETPQRQKKYGAALENIAAFMDKYTAFQDKSYRLAMLFNRFVGPAVLGNGYTIFRTVSERQKPDIKRDTSYQERNIPMITMRQKIAERGYHPAVDRAYAKYTFKKMLDLDIQDVPAALKSLMGKKSPEAIDAFVDKMYDNTKMMDPEARLKMLKMNLKQLRALKDPTIELLAGLEKEAKVLREKSKALDQEYSDLKKVYLAALMEMRGNLAPDANSSIRFTYGNVEGYRPRDAVYYKPVTTLKGVLQKDKGEAPFDVPQRLKELHKKKDFGQYVDKKSGDIVTCFLNTTNVTGGNSGSPVLNARGEQIGIVFDMTYESVIGDYYVIPELQRTIQVDIRYVLFVTEKFSGAKHIIEEMGL
jgi:hypothetical protein